MYYSNVQITYVLSNSHRICDKTQREKNKLKIIKRNKVKEQEREEKRERKKTFIYIKN
jgi:hypothetical protein